MKTSLGNIVCHSNMHPCAQYEIIWTNYATNVAIRLIIWLESHWSPHKIARFWEHFFKIIAVLQVFIFPRNLATYDDTMRRFPNFLSFFWIFYAHFKMRSERREWPFLASGWVLNFFVFLWLNRYLCTWKWFLEKIKSKLRGSYSSNLTRFQLNQQEFVFFTRGG